MQPFYSMCRNNSLDSCHLARLDFYRRDLQDKPLLSKSERINEHLGSCPQEVLTLKSSQIGSSDMVR